MKDKNINITNEESDAIVASFYERVGCLFLLLIQGEMSPSDIRNALITMEIETCHVVNTHQIDFSQFMEVFKDLESFIEFVGGR